MSVMITDQAYEQYQALLNNFKFNQKLESVEETGSLENDIDIPIRGIVGMLALLRFEPLFSCCGFNYVGQPCHKTHQYGTVYVQMKGNLRNTAFIEKAQPFFEVSAWKGFCVQDATFGVKAYISADFTLGWKREQGIKDGEHPWNNKDCIHYCEHGLFAIKSLEKLLLANEHLFSEEVILKDANANMKDMFNNWQYPVLNDWIIKKEDILE